MLMKENSILKEIEEKMNFKFEDLKLIGFGSLSGEYFKNVFTVAIYKFNNKIFEFEFFRGTLITSISEIEDIRIGLKRIDQFDRITFFINEECYNCKFKNLFKISDNSNYKLNTFKYELISKNGNFSFMSNEKLEIAKEEKVTFELLGNFLILND